GCGQAPGPQLDVKRATRSFDGWGVSLAWWAELVGSWSKPNQDAIVGLLYGDPKEPSGTIIDREPVYPLGLNIVRYNIGASGPGDSCPPGFRPPRAVPTVVEPAPGSAAPATANPALLGRD